MTLDKQVKDWEGITQKYFQEYQYFVWENSSEKYRVVREIQELIKNYVTTYEVLYDPMNKPGGEE